MLDTDALLLIDPATSWEEAQEILETHDLGDGLPLVPPTPKRLAAMLAGVADPHRELGQMPPMFGALTPERVAYQCVLAGCRPAELPLVLTAALACLEERFNLLGILTTTGSAAVALMVHGPAVRALGLNAGTNCLGPGNRANAAIGRALALVMRNIAGARPETGDMATMGQPGKYGFCFAEPDAAPFPSFAGRRGVAPGTSAVTVIGVSGTAEVLPAGERGTAEEIVQPIAATMAGALVASGAMRKAERGEQFLLLPAELAQLLLGHGWDLARTQQHLFAVAAAMPPGPVARAAADIHIVVTGGAGVKMAYLPPWGGGTWSVTREVAPP